LIKFVLAEETEQYKGRSETLISNKNNYATATYLYCQFIKVKLFGTSSLANIEYTTISG